MWSIFRGHDFPARLVAPLGDQRFVILPAAPFKRVRGQRVLACVRAPQRPKHQVQFGALWGGPPRGGSLRRRPETDALLEGPFLPKRRIFVVLPTQGRQIFGVWARKVLPRRHPETDALLEPPRGGA